ALPRLVAATQEAEEGAAEAWEDVIKSRSEADRKKAMAKFKRKETALRGHFSKFYFKLKVYEEYIEQLWPVLEEIEGAQNLLERAKHPKTKKDAAIDAKAVNAGLR